MEALTEHQLLPAVNRICAASRSDTELGRVEYDNEVLLCALPSATDTPKYLAQFVFFNTSYQSLLDLITGSQKAFYPWPEGQIFPFCHQNPQRYTSELQAYSLPVDLPYCLGTDQQRNSQIYLGRRNGNQCVRTESSASYNEKARLIVCESAQDLHCEGYTEVPSSEAGEAGVWIRLPSIKDIWQPKKEITNNFQECCKRMPDRLGRFLNDDYTYFSYNPYTKECTHGEKVDTQKTDNGRIRTFKGQ